MLRLSPSQPSKNTTPPSVVEEWLKQNKNGIDKLLKSKIKKDSVWERYGKVPTARLIEEYLAMHDVLVPSEIADTGCHQNVKNACLRKVKAGELVKITVSKKTHLPSGSPKTKTVNAFKRA